MPERRLAPPEIARMLIKTQPGVILSQLPVSDFDGDFKYGGWSARFHICDHISILVGRRFLCIEGRVSIHAEPGGMSPERWRLTEKFFHAAMERLPQARRAFLDEVCDADGELRGQLELLVENDERAGSFLERPLISDINGALAQPDRLIRQQLGEYVILCSLGEGGMGEVYRAHDSNLGRDVAIKALPFEFSHDLSRVALLRHEAQTLAALNHPNIIAIHSLEESEGLIYLVLELVEGENLQGPLPLAAALDFLCQIAEALEAAHEHGIVHRDLKPSNVKVTPEGKVKVLDFGLAQAILGAATTTDRTSQTNGDGSGTRQWKILGTPGYMSPEQVRGWEVDQRTDIWAFGCLGYELLTGKRAFKGGTVTDTIAAVQKDEPDWDRLPAGTPLELRRILRKCLEKNPTRRPRRIHDVRKMLEEVRRGLKRWRFVPMVHHARLVILAACIVLVAGFLGVRHYQYSVRARWVKEQAIPEISRLIDAGGLKAASRLMRRAESILPQDPSLREIHDRIGLPISIETAPPGAEVWATGYNPEDNDWIFLGTTPFTTRELPWGEYRIRIEKRGFQTILGSCEVRGGNIEHFVLDREGAIPPEMVRIPGGTIAISGLGTASLDAFLIDRLEVTNRQFKQFIDRGGYQKREYWKQDFIRGGRRLGWEEAMRLFRDSTGRSGPSTWELGEYPSGHEDYPVSGISWYEAVAYAEFAGKQLPTVYHWQQAAQPGFYFEIATFSNFGIAGPMPVGRRRGIGAFGTLDMANVKEWCWNKIGNQRYSGGVRGTSRSICSRQWTRGCPGTAPFRTACAVHGMTGMPTPEVWLRSPRLCMTSAETTPCRTMCTPVISAFLRMTRFDLDARVEGVDEETRYWKREKISFAAGYGKERVYGYFYIPKGAAPPYQTILYAHPGMAFRLPHPEPAEEHFFDFLIKSGRAFFLPVLKGQYQRRQLHRPSGPNALRDQLLYESREFRRAIDYLVSRVDVDGDRLGVYGLSRGACVLPVLAAGEQRLKAAVIGGAGLEVPGNLPPEVHPLNFASRFRTPTLLINGRSDFIFPLETSQLPFFRLLAAPPKDKRLFLLEGGHGDLTASRQKVIRESLDWFDRYLGPVKAPAPGS
ncbi:MAG: protein kinase [Bryobacterales bacterium]|nr:protein kinase [Bryobacterales bacterium]